MLNIESVVIEFFKNMWRIILGSVTGITEVMLNRAGICGVMGRMLTVRGGLFRVAILGGSRSFWICCSLITGSEISNQNLFIY